MGGGVIREYTRLLSLLIGLAFARESTFCGKTHTSRERYQEDYENDEDSRRTFWGLKKNGFRTS